MSSAPTKSDRLTPEQFKTVSRIAHSEAGLVLVESKASMISARLAKRVRALRLVDLGSYIELLESSKGVEELPNLLSALTTNISHFFRENHHFQALRNEILPTLEDRARKGERIRIWSAGCSRGQELYSVAIVLAEAFPEFPRFDVKLLGTDIDPIVVAAARAGRYPVAQTKGLSNEQLDRHFTSDGDHVVVREEMRRLITFRELNLISDWPMRHPFDVIFCRNVVIYFDSQTQERLWSRFEDAMKPSAYLFLGHSERVQSLEGRQLKSVGITSYRKTETSETMPSPKQDGSKWH